jgi:Ribonucleotide reductase, small chain
MPGLTFSNELISRDEGLHCEFACQLYKMLERPLSRQRILAIITEAVEVEKAFICDALPVRYYQQQQHSITVLAPCLWLFIAMLIRDSQYIACVEALRVSLL